MTTLAKYERCLAGLDADIAAFPSERYSTHSDGSANPVTHSAPVPFKSNGVVLTCGSELTPVAVDWLWCNWLALGKFHLLAGAPGQGKTTIAMSLATTVTIGGRWPDGTRCEAGNVLIWSGEDNPADTLLPRLLAAGVDRTRCFLSAAHALMAKCNRLIQRPIRGVCLAQWRKSAVSRCWWSTRWSVR